jgi:hypothetical protein
MGPCTNYPLDGTWRVKLSDGTEHSTIDVRFHKWKQGSQSFSLRQLPCGNDAIKFDFRGWPTANTFQIATLQKKGGALLNGNRPLINTPGYVIRWETATISSFADQNKFFGGQKKSGQTKDSLADKNYRDFKWVRATPDPKSYSRPGVRALTLISLPAWARRSKAGGRLQHVFHGFGITKPLSARRSKAGPRTDYKPDLPSGPLAPSAPSAPVAVTPAFPEASAPPQAGRMLFAEAIAVPAPASGAPELPMAHATVYKGRM